MDCDDKIQATEHSKIPNCVWKVCECGVCGERNKLLGGNRILKCVSDRCGYETDRDVNGVIKG